MSSTITTKLLATLVTVFSLVLASSTAYQYWQQKELMNSVLSEQLHDKASNYFDSLNMMMLTGTMAQKETLRQKALAQDGIEQVKVLRAEAVSKLYGPGQPSQAPEDEIDQRALKGELVIEPISAEWGKGLVVALPMKASENYRGTNCVSCHMAPEGEVLGAIRLEYNLSHVNSMISQRTIIAVTIMATFGFIGFLLTLFLIRKFIVRPIQKTSRYMQSVSESKDLSKRIKHENKDEIGQLSVAINSFMDTVSHSLEKVQETSHYLNSSAAGLTDVAQVTDQAAHNQQNETSDVQANIEQMQSQQVQVEQATNDASNLIKHTTSIAEQSAGQAHSASTEIKSLVTDIEQVKVNIVELNDQTAEVSTILEVIKGIAEQTNLLALNAAIEAARAGEQGRGFAVVADEVRQLASRTSDATGSIENIISQFQKDSQASLASVDTVCETAHERSNEIEALSVAMSDVVSEMQQALAHAQSIQHQTSNTTQISQQVQRKVEIITQHADNTSQSAAKTRDISMNLEQLSEHLESLINQFTLSRKN
ncbi:methyl-accepting chemotaxis protein [Vibrio sp. Isolate25]|uniref:methyl-accepting chemotaxis protein n=1 Tax=Vibrio sp. Isolate25 TaxID=2908535 RepID=UPI001EFD8CA4|nr:methyl-accepting chemotaxis protein [Vibrio sp. Isolate25]MCG9596966.1 methyl-accepting chemotaxis protein [Vibrio sp. Isolate25]